MIIAGISLHSISGKILARVLLNCLNNYLEHGLLLESQCGFRKKHGTVNMVFAVRQLQEKCQKQNPYLYSIYVDLTKAFDMVSRDCLWRNMAKYGCLRKFITIVKQFHDGMHARVQDNRENAVVLAPTVFSIMFSVMLFDAFSGLDNGINIQYHTDGSVFSTSEDFKQRPRWRLILSFCMPQTVHWTLLPKSTCKIVLTSCWWPVTILA